jgi:hypothetical protein
MEKTMKMTEIQVWEHIKHVFRPSNLVDNLTYYVSAKIDDDTVTRGMCRVIDLLRADHKISDGLHKKVMRRINKEFRTERFVGGRDADWYFLYPNTFYGARKRRELCKRVITELKQKAANRKAKA